MKHKDLWQDFENHLLNQQVTQKRINKLRSMFKAVCRFIDLKTAKREQIEKFVNGLHRNENKKIDGYNYSGSAKSDIKKFLKQYFKHTKGEDEFYPKEVSWIKTNIAKDEKPKEKEVITQRESIKLASHFRKVEFRILTLLLFDAGFRIEEMLTTRKRDLTWDTFDDEGNKCFWIKCSESKTEQRNIPIQLFTEDLKAFMNSTYFQNLKDSDLLFNISYDSYLKMLKKAGKKVLNKVITPHSLRHSSATLYAKLYEGDMIQLANRYAWSYSSKELRTYIRRSKTFHTIGAKKVFSSELLKIKEENQKLKEDFEKFKVMVLKSLGKKYKIS